MTARAVAAGALALSFAACGSSGSAKTNEPCAPPPGFHPLRGELPSTLVPGGTLVGPVTRARGTTTGDLFFTGGVDDTFTTLRAAAESHGYQLTRLDDEGFEAEVEGRRQGEQLRFKVVQLAGCTGVAGGHFVRVGAG